MSPSRIANGTYWRGATLVPDLVVAQPKPAQKGLTSKWSGWVTARIDPLMEAP
jgi:hypothetical protein